jgi:hypothetical protein
MLYSLENVVLQSLQILYMFVLSAEIVTIFVYYQGYLRRTNKIDVLECG